MITKLTEGEVLQIDNAMTALQNTQLGAKVNEIIDAMNASIFTNETFTGSTTDTTVLTKTPVSATAILVFLNGAPTHDYTLAGKTITWPANLEADDIVDVSYAGG